MVLAYFIVTVAVLAGAAAGTYAWVRTRHWRRSVAVGIVSALIMGVIGALTALVAMMIWPPVTVVPG